MSMILEFFVKYNSNKILCSCKISHTTCRV